MLPRLVALAALAAAGCGATFSFPRPMTAAQLAGYDSGPALVAFLAQPDASPDVCDLADDGPHISGAGEELRRELVRGLVDSRIDPELWRRCGAAILRSAPPEMAASLVDEVGKGYREIIRDKAIEMAPLKQAQLRAMQQLYTERGHGVDGHAAIDDPLIGELRRALAGHRLGPMASTIGLDFIATIDLEHGTWQGKPVDLAAIDARFTAGDEQTLRRFADRLPQPELRDQARRRVVRLHIAASPFAEVRIHAAAVEEQLMQKGVNPVTLTEHAPVRSWLDLQKMPMRGVLVRQNPLQNTAELLGYSGDRPAISVLPGLELRGVLLSQLSGISQPVTLCGQPKDLDPSPCIAISDVKMENPAAYLDHSGAFHFVEHISQDDALVLTQTGGRFVLPIAIGGRRATAFDWSLYYERPADLVFRGPFAGAVGPNLGVGVDLHDPHRFVFRVTEGRTQYLAIVETEDAAAFHVISRGAIGAVGATGYSGSDGSSGSECQSGTSGSNGGPGGRGGNGGNGGNVAVRVRCEGVCPDTANVLGQTIMSMGGEGGPGGPGGRGGSGGSGGPSRSPRTHTDSDGHTVTDDSGCSGGSRGSDGMRGSNGSPGSPGRPGRVMFVR